MSDVRQRNVALTWVAPGSIVLLVLVCAFVVPLVPGRYSVGRYVTVLPFLVLALYRGLQPLLWWWRADLRVGDEGIGFGTRHPRRTPAQVTFAARNPWVAPWEALSDVRLVRAPDAVREMRRAANPGGLWPQPTLWAGYFPVARRAALVFDVDLAKLVVPEVKPASSRGPAAGTRGASLASSTLWTFPVRDVDPVLDALRERGIPVTETDRAALPC